MFESWKVTSEREILVMLSELFFRLNQDWCKYPFMFTSRITLSPFCGICSDTLYLR